MSGYPLGLLLNFGAITITGGMRCIVNNVPNGTRETAANAVVLE